MKLLLPPVKGAGAEAVQVMWNRNRGGAATNRKSDCVHRTALVGMLLGPPCQLDTHSHRTVTALHRENKTGDVQNTLLLL